MCVCVCVWGGGGGGRGASVFLIRMRDSLNNVYVHIIETYIHIMHILIHMSVLKYKKCNSMVTFPTVA